MNSNIGRAAVIPACAGIHGLSGDALEPLASCSTPGGSRHKAGMTELKERPLATPLRRFVELPIICSMPFYRFLIHGRDPRHPEDVRGFFTTRHAFGSTQEKAAGKVLSRLHREFTVGVSASIWNSDPPRMFIEEGWRIGLHQIRSAPNKGSTFYEP